MTEQLRAMILSRSPLQTKALHKYIYTAISVDYHFLMKYHAQQRILLITFAAIFSGEAYVMYLLSGIEHLTVWQEMLLDSTLLTVIVSPVIYHLLFKPLRTSFERHLVLAAELKTREEMYRTLVDTMPHGIHESNAKGVITFANPGFHLMYGYEDGEMIGKSVLDLAPSEKERAERAALLEKLIMEKATPETWSGQYRTNDGRLIDVQVDSDFKRDGNGNILGFIAVHTDISKRKRAEEERERVIVDLKKALAEVKQLSGLLPICSYCKKIRDDKGYWNKIEAYIAKHSDAQFSQGICDDCLQQKYPIIEPYPKGEKKKGGKDTGSDTER